MGFLNYKEVNEFMVELVFDRSSGGTALQLAIYSSFSQSAHATYLLSISVVV